jgi:hypothetical protein
MLWAMPKVKGSWYKGTLLLDNLVEILKSLAMKLES